MDERIIPDKTEKGIVSMHLKRYEFAKTFCAGKEVLDAACGAGYGSSALGKAAKSVIGVDVDRGAINYAVERYKNENVRFAVMDLSRKIAFPDGSFDVVCSFETIEHLRNVPIYLEETNRILKEGGIFIVSTPYVRKTNNKPLNTHHFIEYSLRDLAGILKAYFKEIEFYGQKRKANNMHRFLRRLDVLNIRARLNPKALKRLSHLTGNTPFAELSLDDIDIVKGDFVDATEAIAVCRKR